MTVAARLSRLAWLLLGSAKNLSLAFALCSMSACILPIGPDFQDPLSAPNSAPMILGASPQAGFVVTGSPTGMSSFHVTVLDLNGEDDLHVRWLADYPPKQDATRIVVSDRVVAHSPDNQPVTQDVSQDIGCSNLLAPGLTQHQIMVLIADRAYESVAFNTDNLTNLIDDKGYVTSVSWTLSLECRSP
jgi:hypothetical protein